MNSELGNEQIKAWTAHQDPWRAKLKIGDWIDALAGVQLFDYSIEGDASTKQWRQARIEKID